MQTLELHAQENEQSIGDPMLDDLAVEINRAHEKCEDAVNDSIRFAVQAGQALIKVKEFLNHGDWLPWLKRNCKCSPREAQRYKRIAKAYPDWANATRASHLSMREALKLLAEKEQCRTGKKRGNSKPAVDAGAVSDSQTNGVCEQMSKPAGSNCEKNERVAFAASSSARTEDQGATRFIEPIRRASKEEDRPHLSIARPPLNQVLTFAENTPEAVWIDNLVADLQADAMKCAERITNQARETGNVDVRYVQQALLKKLAKRLESVIAE